MTAPRQIAVVVDGPPTPAWQARVLAGLERSQEVEVVEVRLAGRARRGPARQLRDAVERHIFPVGDDPLASVEIAPRTAGMESATLVVWLCEQPVPATEQRDLLRVRHDGLSQPVERAFRAAVLERRPCVESEAVLRSDRGTVVAERTISAVGPASETASRTLALWKLADLLIRAVERLPGLDERTTADDAPPSPRAGSALRMRDVASWLRAPATRLALLRPWWIRVRVRGEAPTKGWQEEDRVVRWGDGRMYADPFIFEREGRHHLFCETVPSGSKKGVIAHTELHLDGALASPPKIVLDLDYHLSYPCVFEHGGEVFMIPETAAVRRIELHRAVSFPDVWEREEILIDDIAAVDTTFFEHDGRLWLFAGVAAEGGSYSDELHLFWADSPRGPWHAHARNPVVSDVRGARPAGAIQRWGSRIVRPAQDCSRRYGAAVSFREIDVLSTSDYAEREVDRLLPADLPRARATHTYAADSHFEAIDLRRREPRAGLRRIGLAKALAALLARTETEA
ncbi:MAG TPA: hypothetical protein VHT27_11035 [Solirubrobacteraceae bacterium]|nr:hypothetical protein [Solirubrobacteraceae bacterium]